MRKHLGKIIISVLIVSVAAFIFVFKPDLTRADWLDPRWSFRKEITINGSADGVLTNYQMKLTIHRSTNSDSGSDVYVGTNCDSTYKDIRFTQSDGTTLLDYWIESSDSNSAVVWIKFDSIPQSSAATFYFYYGSSIATSLSNGDNTFTLFDDFPGTSLNAQWGTSGDVSVSGGICTIGGTSNFSQIYANFGDTNQRVRTREKTTILSNGYNGIISWGDGTNGAFQASYKDIANYFQNDFSGGNQAYADLGVAKDTSNYHIHEIIRNGTTSIIHSIDNSIQSTNTTQVFTGGAWGSVNFAAGDQVLVDWIFISQYVSPEPTWGSWGSGEIGPTPIPAVKIKGGVQIRGGAKLQ